MLGSLQIEGFDGASHCLTMVFIRALACPLCQNKVRPSVDHQYIIDISIDDR